MNNGQFTNVPMLVYCQYGTFPFKTQAYNLLICVNGLKAYSASNRNTYLQQIQKNHKPSNI